MAVQRFRTIQEIAAAPVVVPPGDGFERFARHCARYWAIAPRTYPRGVFRFRTIPEAQAARERVADDNAAQLRAVRKTQGGSMDAVEPFLALVVYPTTPNDQVRHADNLVRMAADELRLLPGFLRGRVFVSEDGQSIVSLVEWSSRASFEEFRQSEFGRAATVLMTGLHPTAYWLRHHAAIDAP